MKLIYNIWRQESSEAEGAFVRYEVDGLSPEMSFLESLDYLNEKLVLKKERVIAFEYDCREGICGQCGVVLNGRVHGPHQQTTTCQLHLRSFKDGDELWVEPFRSSAFQIVQDLVVDRSAFDRIIEQGGYVSANTGTAPEANNIPIAKLQAESAMDAAACIGCGACVATCKNSSAALFVSAKLNHLKRLPQGKVEAKQRLKDMTEQMEKEGFGHCSFTGACEVECPQGISISNIAEMNSDTLFSIFD